MSQTAYLTFSRREWLGFRDDTPLTLTEADVEKLHGQTQTMSLAEVADIYLPLSRLLNFYVTAIQSLHHANTEYS